MSTAFDRFEQGYCNVNCALNEVAEEIREVFARLATKQYAYYAYSDGDRAQVIEEGP
jgi:hypothetical protein